MPSSEQVQALEQLNTAIKAKDLEMVAENILKLGMVGEDRREVYKTLGEASWTFGDAGLPDGVDWPEIKEYARQQSAPFHPKHRSITMNIFISEAIDRIRHRNNPNKYPPARPYLCF